MASVGFGGPGILVLGVAGVGGGVCDTLSGDYGGAHAEGHCEPANPTDIARSTHCFLLYRRLATRQTLRPSPQREGANSAINFLRRQFRVRRQFRAEVSNSSERSHRFSSRFRRADAHADSSSCGNADQMLRAVEDAVEDVV